jgi:hypothetical protein
MSGSPGGEGSACTPRVGTCAHLASAFLLLLACGAGPPKAPDRPPEERKFRVACTDLQRQCLSLRNTGKETARFVLELNGRPFLQSLDQALDEVRAMPEESPGEPLWRKAWRYTRDQVVFGKPISSASWYEEPCLLLNSAGFGYCDDMAELNCRIWRALGYESRLWYLEGHVVSEVKVDGRWEMYDSDFGVYYLTPQGRVAGVQELADHTEWILRPAVRLPDLTTSGSRYAYAPSTARIYETAEDNRPIRIGERTAAPWSFTLPPGGSLRFPLRAEVAHGEAGEEASGGKVIRSWLELCLPAGWNGSLTMYLIFDEVYGAGRLLGRGWSRDVGREGTLGREVVRRPSPGRIGVETTEPVSLRYLLSARWFPLREQNVLRMSGSGLAGCEADAAFASPENGPFGRAGGGRSADGEAGDGAAEARSP